MWVISRKNKKNSKISQIAQFVLEAPDKHLLVMIGFLLFATRGNNTQSFY